MAELPERIWVGHPDDEHCEVWFDPDEGGTEYVRAEPPPALGVKVKPLVWECFDAWTHWARMERGSYYVEERNGRWRLGWRVNDQSFPLMHADDTMPESLDEAQSAAQADYDARIRAALEPDTSPALGAAWMQREAAGKMGEFSGRANNILQARAFEHAEGVIRAIPAPTPAQLLDEALRMPEVTRLVFTLKRIAEFDGDDADLDEWGAADLCRHALAALPKGDA